MMPLSLMAADKSYNPPFELSGVVSNISETGIEVFVPRIEKTMSVKISSRTRFIDRMDKNGSAYGYEDIAVDDLVVVTGIIKNDSFLAEQISFLAMAK